MSSDAGDLAKIVLLLGDRSSAKRSSAAKKLRKLAQPEVCHQVLQALHRELEDERTWETHYQMVMALAESGCRTALPFLQNLSHRHFEHSMVLTAIGDALGSPGRLSENDETSLLAVLIGENSPLMAGALRATARLTLKFSVDVAKRVLELVEGKRNESLLFGRRRDVLAGRALPFNSSSAGAS